MGKQVDFKHIKENGEIILGVVDEIGALPGNLRDGGGCDLSFKTMAGSAGIEEKFSVYLLPVDINKMTLAVWQAYFRADPTRARQNFKTVLGTVKQWEDRMDAALQ